MSAPAFEFRLSSLRPPLDAFVEAVWAVRGSGGYRRFVMLPNGALQLMVNFGAPHRVLRAGGRTLDRDCRAAWIAGLQDAPLEIESPEQSDLLAIRFRPGGAHAILPLPLHAVTNEVIEADTLVGRADRDALDQAAKSRPIFRRLLVTGFNGAHWPLWPLLRAGATASMQATVILSDPRDEARDLDETWVGTWEEAFGPAQPIGAAKRASVLAFGKLESANRKHLRRKHRARNIRWRRSTSLSGATRQSKRRQSLR